MRHARELSREMSEIGKIGEAEAFAAEQFFFGFGAAFFDDSAFLTDCSKGNCGAAKMLLLFSGVSVSFSR
jgi:hypothetical protein